MPVELSLKTCSPYQIYCILHSEFGDLKWVQINSSYDRSSSCQMFFKIGFPKNFAIFTGSTCVGVSFLTIKKETPTQVFSCEYCKNFKKAF